MGNTYRYNDDFSFKKNKGKKFPKKNKKNKKHLNPYKRKSRNIDTNEFE